MENGLASSPSAERGRLIAQYEKKWTVRRTLGLVMFVSGLFWLSLGLMLHFLLY
jgi:hypothetical protein